jgi:hypothetical protein
MKKTTLIAATVASFIAMPALAGNMAEPIMEPSIITTEMDNTSSASPVLPIILFALLAALAASN